MSKFLFRILLSAVFCCCASAGGIDTDYRGPDAGYLVFSTSSLKIAMNFAFNYARKGEHRDPNDTYETGVIRCKCVGFWKPTMSDPDFEGYETGKVQIQRLPPGDYEVYTLSFDGSIIVASLHWFPKNGFSIPFTIKPGEATYIGNFARAPSLGTPLQATLGAAGYFVVSDKHERDLPIAKGKLANLPPATVSVFDVSQLNVPFLLAKDLYATAP